MSDEKSPPPLLAPPADRAREEFPRGLRQPETGFRFSLDALLLACFAARKPWRKVLDLGSGCGVVGLGLLLAQDAAPQAEPGLALGVDREPDMVRAAQNNAARLGFAERYKAHCLDLRQRDATWRHRVPPGGFDLVVANPPYRAAGSGRQNPEPRRADARFENHADLQDFIQAAKGACATKGRFCLVHLAERLAVVCALLEAHGFALKQLLPVHSRSQEPARLVLLEARKQGGEGLVLEPPLVLYEGRGQDTTMTGQALAFCPFLACNARGRGTRGELFP